MPFQLISVFCGAPGMLHAEGEVFYEIAGEVNEAEGARSGILFLPLNLHSKAHPQEVIDQNIRQCAYYILVLEDTFGGSTFKYDYRYALQCCGDPNLPMKEVVVLFKKPGPLREVEPPVEQFRKSLETGGGARYFDFDGMEEFRKLLQTLLTEWLRGIAKEKAVGA